MAQYYGITVGPIMQTLMLTAKPAGLWCGSYIFSYLVRNLCEALMGSGVDKKDFLAPCFETQKNDDGDLEIVQAIRGVGLFHDRIIFKGKDKTMPEISEIAEKTKRELGKRLAEAANRPEAEDFMTRYLQIHIVCREVGDDENPVVVLSKYLDISELMYTFNQNYVSNPILDLFDKDRDDGISVANFLKKSFLIEDCRGQWPLIKKGDTSIMNMEDIAGTCTAVKDLKQYKYCALIKADGDNMTRVLVNLKEHDKIQDFTKCCLNYEVEAVKEIKNYGAVNIYAGGDDLMFIAPLTGSNGDTLFNLLKSIRNKFYKAFKDQAYEYLPTLSFGVVIHYYKFPLYEWTQEANAALENGAKKVKDKDTLVVNLTKHSGKKRMLVLEKIHQSEVYTEFLKLVEAVQRGSITTQGSFQEEFLSSVPQKLQMFQTVFLEALRYGDQAVANFMENTFDAQWHGKDKIEAYLNRILSLTLAIRKYALGISKEKLETLNENLYRGTIKNVYDFMYLLLCDMLQTASFLIEKKEDE